MKAKTTLYLTLGLFFGACQGPRSGDTDTEIQRYELDTCVITDSKLGSMGDPITKVYGKREIKFCCEPCIAEFEKDPEFYIEMMDEALAQRGQ